MLSTGLRLSLSIPSSAPIARLSLPWRKHQPCHRHAVHGGRQLGSHAYLLHAHHKAQDHVSTPVQQDETCSPGFREGSEQWPGHLTSWLAWLVLRRWEYQLLEPPGQQQHKSHAIEGVQLPACVGFDVSMLWVDMELSM